VITVTTDNFQSYIIREVDENENRDTLGKNNRIYFVLVRKVVFYKESG